MSGEQFFKFNKDKGIDFTSFKLKLDSTNEAGKKRNALLNIFDKDGNGEINGDEIFAFFGTLAGYAGIKDDNTTLDSDEAELLISFLTNSAGESLKEQGITASDIFEFAKKFQATGEKAFERKQRAYFNKLENSVRNQVTGSNIKEAKLSRDFNDVESYARNLLGLKKKDLTPKEAEKLTRKIIELQLLNGIEFKYTKDAVVKTSGEKFAPELIKKLKAAGISPNPDTHGIFLYFSELSDEEQNEVIKVIKNNNVKTSEQFKNAIEKQRSADLQNYAVQVLLNNIISAIETLQQTEDNMGVSFETASEYIKKGVYAVFGWNRMKPISEAKKEMEAKLKSFQTQLSASLKNGTFKQTFRKLTGVEYDEKKIEEFIKFSSEQDKKSKSRVQGGEIGAMNASLENINYQIKMKETFGIDFTRGAQDAQFRSADDGAGLSLVAMIALMAKFSGSAAGRSFTSAVYNTTARVLPRGMARVATSSIVGGSTLAGFTASEQIVRNLTKKAPTTKEDWQNTGWATLQSFGFGAFMGAFGSTAGKWVTEKSFEGFSKVLKNTKFMQTNAQALSKVSSNLNRLSSGGSMKATDIIKTLQSTSAPEFAAHALGFAAEIGGCTGYAALIEQPIKDMYNNGGFNESSIRAAMYQACKTPEEIEHVKNLSGAELYFEYTKEKLEEQAEMLTKVKGISTVLGGIMGGKLAQYTMLNATEIKKVEVNGKEMFEIKTPLVEKPITVESPEMVTFICKQVMALDIANEVKKPEIKLEEKEAENISENPAADALEAREAAIKRGEIFEFKNVEFDEGFGINYKSSTNPLSKGELYFGDKKLASSKKELLKQFEENRISFSQEINRYIDTLKTPEDFQTASALFYKIKYIGFDMHKYADSLKEPQDGIILGMLLSHQPYLDLNKALKQIKENPNLYKVFEECIPILQSYRYGDSSSMLGEIMHELKTPERCEAFIKLIKSTDNFGTIRRLGYEGFLPENIEEVKAYLNILNYTYDTELAKSYLSLPPEARSAIEPILVTKENPNARQPIKLEEMVCKNLLEGLKNPEIKESLLKFIENNKDIIILEQKYRTCLYNGCDKEILDKINALDATGVEFNRREYDYTTRKDLFDREAFNRLIESLTNETLNTKLGRTATFEEATLYRRLETETQRQYIFERLNDEMSRDEIEILMQHAGRIKNEEQTALADFLKTDNRYEFVILDGNWASVRSSELYNFLKTKEDIDAFIKLTEQLPAKTGDTGLLYKNLIESGRLAQGISLMESCGALKSIMQEAYFCRFIEQAGNGFQQAVVFKLNELAGKRPELSEKIQSLISSSDKFMKSVESQEIQDKIINNIETLAEHPEIFDYIREQSTFTGQYSLQDVLLSNNFDMQKFDMIKNLIKDGEFNADGDAMSIVCSNIDIKTLEKCLEKSNSLSTLSSFAKNYSEYNAPLMDILLKDGRFDLNSINNLAFFRGFEIKDKEMWDTKLEFYNEFKNDNRFEFKEFYDILRSINDSNIELAKDLCTREGFPKEYIKDILNHIKTENLEFAKYLCNKTDFPKEHIADILSYKSKINEELSNELCNNKDFPKEHIAKILEFAYKSENLEKIQPLLSTPEFSKWITDNLTNGLPLEVILDLSRTQKKLFAEAEKTKSEKPKTAEPPVVEEAKPEQIQQAEAQLVSLGVHPKMAPNYVKMCQDKGIVDKVKLDAVCALASVGVPVKEIKNIFNIAVGSPLSNANGIFRPDIIKDIVIMKQNGVEDIKLATNISAVKNMSEIELKSRINTKVREDLVNRLKELPDEVKRNLTSAGIDLETLEAKALAEPKGGKVNKEAKPQPVQLRALDSIVGVERIILNKFKTEIDQSIWGDPVRFKAWAEERLAKILEADYSAEGNYAHYNDARKSGIESWYKFLKEESNYKDNVFVHLLVMDGITREMKPNNAYVPPAVSHESFEATYNALLENHSTVSFSKIYAQQTKLRAIEQFSKGKQTVDGVEGQWVTIPRSRKSSPDYDERIAMVQALSEGSSWCLRFDHAHDYLQKGNLHFFVDTQGNSQVAINETDGKITQIQKRYNQDSTVPVPYATVISEWAKANNYSGQEIPIQNALNAKPKFDELREKFAKLQAEGNYLEIFKELGINVTTALDGTYILSGYKAKISSQYTIAELGINENALMQNVSQISSEVNLEGSTLTALPKLRVITGSLKFGDNKISDLRTLESINGTKVSWAK